MDTNLPEVGKQYQVRDQLVTVVDVKKRGRGWQVFVTSEFAAWPSIRLKDWQKATQ